MHRFRFGQQREQVVDAENEITRKQKLHRCLASARAAPSVSPDASQLTARLPNRFVREARGEPRASKLVSLSPVGLYVRLEIVSVDSH